MRSTFLASALWAVAVQATYQPINSTAAPTNSSSPSSSSSSGLGPDADGKYTITGTGIRATFVAYGASISNLFLNDTSGIERDVVTGWDNASYYQKDLQHPYFGGVPGRYANRIKNSTFEIDGETYHILPNEHKTPEYPKGLNTLHGGPNGWDWRIWNVVAQTESSITFSLFDKDGEQGFPGDVISYVTYSLGNMTWDFSMSAISLQKKTPIMLSSHVYWNLDGFANNETATALNHTLHLPYGGQRVGTDGILIPTGDIVANEKDGLNDFWSKPKQIGANFTNPDLLGNCGDNCTGYDTCYLTNRIAPYHWEDVPVASLSSAWSGISLDVYTDQEAFQVYSCGGQNGSVALKSTQGLFDVADRPRVIEQYGCIVMEVEDWVGAVNHPEWNRDSKIIFGPEDGPYVLKARYKFGLDG
ncbi:related to aldose 1-epimerase [Rhynchosporium agropyri]|uniref:Related to aldose 1-epimerase n=1 Tax=Rhynchosporium agropyri TaxID=914238 RepID=A0A1E1L1P6_9HELO|nr:related to aldose 1-epimerase [Rhynchosporium agropyri]